MFHNSNHSWCRQWRKIYKRSKKVAISGRSFWNTRSSHLQFVNFTHVSSFPYLLFVLQVSHHISRKTVGSRRWRQEDGDGSVNWATCVEAKDQISSKQHCIRGQLSSRLYLPAVLSWVDYIKCELVSFSIHGNTTLAYWIFLKIKWGSICFFLTVKWTK